MRSVVLCIAMLSALFVVPEAAQAGGFEVPAAGARSLGRGGAWAARADDPMALLYNPANLTELSGVQLHVSAHMLLFDGCITRDGMEEVCADGPPGGVPEIALSWGVNDRLGFGIGLVAPAAVGWSSYGDPETGRQGSNPAPTRYSLIDQTNLIAYLAAGVGYRFHERFRAGFHVGAGVGMFDFLAALRPTPGGDSVPDELDIRTHLQATDWFIPRATLSLHAVPHDNLDIMVGFTWIDDVGATGTLDLRSAYYGDEFVGARTDDCPAGLSADQMERCLPILDDVSLEAAMPWQVSFGIRYADRLVPRANSTSEVEARTGRTEDPMTTERWDIELDVVYEMNSRLDYFRIGVPGDNSVVVENFAPPFPIPAETWIPHLWKDQWSFRLGGDYNIMPGLASIRAGVSFETRGMNEDYPVIDFWPMQRFGGHVGLTLRAGKLDVHLAYAFIFQETLTVSGGQLRQPVANCPTCADPEDAEMRTQDGGEIISDGTYESSFHHLALGVNYRFN